MKNPSELNALRFENLQYRLRLLPADLQAEYDQKLQQRRQELIKEQQDLLVIMRMEADASDADIYDVPKRTFRTLSV